MFGLHSHAGALFRGVFRGPLSRALGCPAAAEKAHPDDRSCHGVPGRGGAPGWGEWVTVQLEGPSSSDSLQAREAACPSAGRGRRRGLSTADRRTPCEMDSLPVLTWPVLRQRVACVPLSARLRLVRAGAGLELFRSV